MQPKVVFVESDDLTDKQRLFCIYYIKSFNQTMAAIKAGYSRNSARVEGSRLIRIPKVAEEIRRLKGEMQKGNFIDAMDVLNKYIQIAFADITDLVEFGSIEMEQRHPETGINLGEIELIKGMGKVIHVQENMATIESIEKEYKTVKINPLFAKITDRHNQQTETIDLPFENPLEGDFVKRVK